MYIPIQLLYAYASVPNRCARRVCSVNEQINELLSFMPKYINAHT